MTTARPALQTTMIGSLPHHNIDAALAFAFQTDIPFLPQIPIRNPWEFMIAQALEGMPGLDVEANGTVTLDVRVWRGRAHALNDRLLNAFAAMPVRHEAFEMFEPSSSTSSGWQSFLWELQERGIKTAKVQIAGPLTAQWALRFKDGSNLASHTDVATQIHRLVLARALAMCRRLQGNGIQPILFLDEPGLYGFTASDPRHALALQELKTLVQALRKERVIVGLHCCSNTDWAAVLSLDINILSIDAKLSLENLLKESAAVEKFLRGGGRLSLGVIPTTKIFESDTRLIFEELREIVAKSPLGRQPALLHQALATALYTPSCGLALHSTADAEGVLATLREFGALCKKALG